MTKILAINGSYRDGGITDQAVTELAPAVEAAGGLCLLAVGDERTPDEKSDGATEESGADLILCGAGHARALAVQHR